jgi:RimJ/RimL family protein N-acetyltransferase
MKSKLQPYIESDVVKIRPLEASDFESLYTLAADPKVWQQHQNKDRYTFENFTIFFNEAIASKGALTIIDVKTKDLIGSSRFKIIDESEKIVEIGWSFLGISYWGGTYNRAFKKLMVNYALEYCNAVIFFVNPLNYRSQKAMEKLGAKKMSYAEKPWVLKENIGITYCLDSPIEDLN